MTIKTAVDLPYGKKFLDENGNIVHEWHQLLELLADFCNNRHVEWTPEITASTSAPTITYSIQHGHYITFGTLVYVGGIVVVSTVSGGSGNLQVTLPFTVHDDTDRPRFSVFTHGIDWGASVTQVVWRGETR